MLRSFSHNLTVCSVVRERLKWTKYRPVETNERTFFRMWEWNFCFLFSPFYKCFSVFQIKQIVYTFFLRGGHFSCIYFDRTFILALLISCSVRLCSRSLFNVSKFIVFFLIFFSSANENSVAIVRESYPDCSRLFFRKMQLDLSMMKIQPCDPGYTGRVEDRRWGETYGEGCMSK